MNPRQPPCDNAGLSSGPTMSTFSDPNELPPPQRQVRPGVGADAPAVDAWLMQRAPLAVPEARARRLSLDALLEQGGHGICLLGGTNAVRDNLVCLMPVTLIHSLSTGGRVAMVAEWWPLANAGHEWLDDCCAVLVDWCRAHGIRHIALASGIATAYTRPPEGFQRDGSGLWVRNLVPTPKRLG